MTAALTLAAYVMGALAVCVVAILAGALVFWLSGGEALTPEDIDKESIRNITTTQSNTKSNGND